VEGSADAGEGLQGPLRSEPEAISRTTTTSQLKLEWRCNRLLIRYQVIIFPNVYGSEITGKGRVLYIVLILRARIIKWF
jgi:hypothetical protein